MSEEKTRHEQLRYIGDSPKDELWIDLAKTSEELVRDMVAKHFGRYHTPPGEILRVHFHLYQKVPSYLQIDHNAVKFNYTINGQKGFYSLDVYFSEPIDDKKTRRVVVPMTQRKITKKVIAKHILSTLLANTDL